MRFQLNQGDFHEDEKSTRMRPQQCKVIEPPNRISNLFSNWYKKIQPVERILTIPHIDINIILDAKRVYQEKFWCKDETFNKPFKAPRWWFNTSRMINLMQKDLPKQTLNEA